MILRRFAKALRQQDWTTIAIEFVIVVAGIFVGLQADEWNRSRVLATEEHALLSDLYEETLGSIRLQEIFIARIGRWLEVTEAVIDAIDNDNLSELSDAEIVFGLRSVNFSPPLNFPRKVLERYNRKGGLEALDQPNLERYVTEYSESIRWTIRAIALDGEESPYIIREARGSIRAHLAPDKEEFYGIEYTVDRNHLKSDVNLRQALLEAFYFQKNALLNHRTDLLNNTFEACNSLAVYLGYPECASRPNSES